METLAVFHPCLERRGFQTERLVIVITHKLLIFSRYVLDVVETTNRHEKV